jgi:hypothetical protein
MGWASSFIGIMLAVLPVATVLAQLESERSLYGLEEVGIVVDSLHPDVERRGVSRAKIQSDLAQKLRQAGIRILTGEQWKELPGSPFLYLYIGVEPLDSFPVYSVTVRLQLRQQSCLSRNLIICGSAVTWENVGAIRMMSVAHLASIPEEVGTLVDRFIAAYQEENVSR